VRTFLYRAGAALFTAAAIVGLFTVTGAPLTLRQQVISALAAGVAVQVYVELLHRRTRSGSP